MPGIIVAVLALLALLTIVAVRLWTSVPSGDPDPLLVVGIVVAGTGATLTAATGPQMAPMIIVGIVLIAVGARRPRTRGGRG